MMQFYKNRPPLLSAQYSICLPLRTITTLMMNKLCILLLITSFNFISCAENRENSLDSSKSTTAPDYIPCSCGVFMSGQFKRGTLPKSPPVFLHEHDEKMSCSSLGNKQCINKCLEVLVRHLANSPAIICGAIDRDCHRERAYLFIKNCDDKWVNSNLSAGREYCCKDGVSYKCRQS